MEADNYKRGNPLLHGRTGVVEVAKFIVNYDDTSPLILCTAEDGDGISSIVVKVTEAWNDSNKALTIGDAANPDGFAEDIGAGLGTPGYYNLDHDVWGAYLWHAAGSHQLTKVYDTQTNIIATFVGDADGSTGICEVYLVHQHFN